MSMSTIPSTVSIVIPAYNEEASIRACVVAAILQTVPASEIIVVDNKSTDGTAAIVRAVQAEYPDSPVLYFQQNEVQGLVPTRNFGLDRAQGRVIGSDNRPAFARSSLKVVLTPSTALASPNSPM